MFVYLFITQSFFMNTLDNQIVRNSSSMRTFQVSSLYMSIPNNYVIVNFARILCPLPLAIYSHRSDPQMHKFVDFYLSN